MRLFAAHLGAFATGAAWWFGRWDYVVGCFLLTLAALLFSPKPKPKPGPKP
jgi:hypothetical protein